MGQSLQATALVLGFTAGLIIASVPELAISQAEGVALGIGFGSVSLLAYTYSPLPNTTGFGFGGGSGTEWGFRDGNEDDEVTE